MTITEIAEYAQVSIGTVDRVIHNRKGVSEKTKKLIQAIIEEHGYQPNPIARQLKSNKPYVIGILLPTLESGCGYYSLLYQGMQKGAQALKPFNIKLKLVTYNRKLEGDVITQSKLFFRQQDRDGQAFEDRDGQATEIPAGQYAKAPESQPPQPQIDALITSPVKPEEHRKLVSDLQLQKKPYVFIDSPLSQSQSLLEISQNPYKAGFCAGRIMKMLRGSGSFVCLKMYTSGYNLCERIRGFTDFIRQDKNSRVLDELLPDFSGSSLTSFMDELFNKHSDIKGIFVPHAEVNLIADYLSEKGLKNHISLIGFDLVEENKASLLSSSIDCIIGQRPEDQGFEAVQKLYQSQVLHQNIPSKIEIPIDIYFKENVL